MTSVGGLRGLASAALLSALAGCGGSEGDGASAPAAAVRASHALGAVGQAAPAAAATPSITPGQLFDWAQIQFPTLFPAGPADQALTAGGVAYTLRYYPGTANYLGVGDADGVVYGLGAFSGNVIASFGTLADYTCDVTGRCAVFSPDADGNLGAGPLRAAAVTIKASGDITFQGLGPLDQVIEVNSPGLTSEQLCTAPSLPAGTAHAVPQPWPTPATLYPTNELSGPYRTYPAGVFAMSVGSDDCGYVEKTSACTAPNEIELARQPRPGGGTDYLCVPTRYLMNPARPTLAANDPPQANPACVPSRTMDATWGDPGIQGLFLRLDWNELNPAHGVYDWSLVDREFAKAVRYGKTVTLGIRVGGNSIPDWVFATGDPALGPARKLRLRDWDTQPGSLPNANCGIEYTAASPSDAAFKALFKKVLAELAMHLRADQRRFSMLGGVKVTGLGMATLENRLPQRCNIALANPALGDTGTQGHIVSLESASLSTPVFEPRYNLAADPAAGRVKDRSLCVCNPQVLQFAGYRPSTVYAFYREVEATLHEQLGHKQKVFMNVTSAFPQVGEGGRFLGDHLAPPIVSMSTNAAGDPVYTFGTVRATRAVVPTDIPDDGEITKMLVADGRAGGFAGGDLTAARGFGVENAALGPIGFTQAPNQGLRCDQQAAIATSGTFAGSAVFPIAATAKVDATTDGCPNWVAAKEGIAYDKAGGFQVVNSLEGAVEIDAALWNLTLNTNGLFFEFYEQDAWIARKQAAWNVGGVLNPAPAVQKETATVNHAAATAKSTAAWNALLLARAAAFSADAAHANPYQANPYPSSYRVAVSSSQPLQRWFFNARACSAWAERGVPVRINQLSVVN